ncbi:hypothetical protein [Pseudorhizobium marinum]|uniref:hypothetical protein n=1 Tax=Pseudorhizobium marinum TaxID=1496690 RepID=UPI0012DCBBA1|nr:hypothetical protein [Pseudorhizobium marinum]
MPLHHTWNSIALDRTDVAMLREAVQIAAKAAGTTREDERQHLASIVFSFYSRGLMDPRRLAEIAVLASSSRLFRSQYYGEADQSRAGEKARTVHLK